MIARFIQDTLITDLQTIGDFVLWETGTKLRVLKLYNYVAKHYALVPANMQGACHICHNITCHDPWVYTICLQTHDSVSWPWHWLVIRVWSEYDSLMTMCTYSSKNIDYHSWKLYFGASSLNLPKCTSCPAFLTLRHILKDYLPMWWHLPRQKLSSVNAWQPSHDKSSRQWSW